MLVDKYDFVVFLNAEWETKTARNRQHFLIAELARQLEGKSKILAVERPVCPWTTPVCNWDKFYHWLLCQKGLRHAGPNLYIYTPFVFIHNLIAALTGMTIFNRRLLKSLLTGILKKLDFRMENLVAWIHDPFQSEDIGLVGEKFLVYDCFDDHLSQDRGLWPANLEGREKAILFQANLVLTVSEKLLNLLQGQANRVCLLPNGVDYGLFARAVSPEMIIPPELVVFPSPIIGFVGKISPLLDFELLAWLAAGHPEWNFVFIGDKSSEKNLSGKTGYSLFKRSSNVHLIGPKNHTNLPSYIKAFDVCLIPYLLEGQIPFSSPLKLYEYLASGQPIVSVNIPQVAEFEPLVYVARTKSEFELCLNRALTEGRNNELYEQRLKEAQRNSWEKRAIKAIVYLDELISEQVKQS